jgi:hypothetical protein
MNSYSIDLTVKASWLSNVEMDVQCNNCQLAGVSNGKTANTFLRVPAAIMNAFNVTAARLTFITYTQFPLSQLTSLFKTDSSRAWFHCDSRASCFI